MKRMTRNATTFAFALGILLSACSPAGTVPNVPVAQPEGTPEPRTVQVSASGSAEAEPDTVVLLLGAETAAAEAQDAIDDNNSRMADVQQALTEAGVAEEDIQTAQYDVFIERSEPRLDEDAPEQRRFRVIHVLQIRSDQVDDAGELLQTALDAGANIVRDVRFTIEDPTSLQQQARSQALEAARAKAEELADGLDAELGPPRRIQEGGDGTVPLQRGVQLEAAQADQAPIASGTLTVSVTVNVTFDLQVD